jgi:hypothetical protein
MSFLGKLLVCVHLALSLLFMAFAGAVYTAHNNWKNAADSAKNALAAAQSKAQTDVAAVQTLLEQAQQKNTQLENEKTTLQGQVTTLQQDNARLDADNKALKIEVDTFRTSSQLASQEAAERKEESKVQRARNADLNASRDSLVAELNQERDKTFAQELVIADMKQKHDKLLRDTSIMRAFLASKELPVDTAQMTAATTPPPALEGVVLRAQREAKGSRVFVEISVGQDDGLVVGHTMTVFRGGKYKGRIRLEDVRPDKSVGVVVETAPNSKIEKDDYVTTRI